ncbi:hypothetical protein ACVWY2_006429 [Bradyrhizobium sp. JR6.1]
MADHDATMFSRQSTSDLLRRMSHRKAFADAVPQGRLARQLEAAILPSPTFGQLLSPDRFVTALPDLGRPRVALQLPTYRRRRAVKRRRNIVLRFTACMQAVNLNAPFKAELAITLSHRHNTLAGVALVS